MIAPRGPRPGLQPMPVGLGGCAGGRIVWLVELDRGWSVVSGAGVAGSFDSVGVVSGAFDDAGVGARAAVPVGVAGHFGERGGPSSGQAVRGKWPPGR